MWRANLKRGTIWSTKSINQYDEYYEGMTINSCKVYILSTFRCIDSSVIFTYLNVKEVPDDNRLYIKIKFNDKYYYIYVDEIKTGNINALQNYKCTLSNTEINQVISSLKDYYNLHFIKAKPIENVPKNKQQALFKFGIDVYVTEGLDVKISDKKQIILSNKAKQDIVYNSTTEEQLIDLCNKYKIYPVKAIKEIKSRLVYQFKQKGQ